MSKFSNNNIIQNTIQNQLKNEVFENEVFENKDEIDFNPLQVYFGDDYIINDKIIIRQPTIQDFIDYGETNIYNVIAPFVANTTGYRVILWDMGIDWNKITNYELFSVLIQTIKFQYSQIIFPNIDFSLFKLKKKETDNNHLVLYSNYFDIELDENTVNKMCKYIQYMFHTYPPEEEFTSNKRLKQELIDNDRQKQILREKKIINDNNNQSLLSKISFCLNHPGFKYKKSELRELGIAEFMDSVQRLQIYESTHALINGCYSGYVDTKKINKSEFDFMRDISILA